MVNSVSSETVNPSIRYVGRLTTDPLGTMPQGEFTLVNGTGSNSSERWGDYSSMNLDPVDGCKFWYTNEYGTAAGNWATQIGVFSFNSCEVLSFEDVPPGYWAEDFLYTIFDEGITTGCSQDPPLYCPEDTVSRAQMAVFLGKALHGSGFSPPPATGIFDDVPASHWAADWIEQAYVDGITNGCNTNLPLYCPDDDVNRSQIAVLLLRGKHGGSYKPPADWHIYRCANKSLGGRLD